MKKQAGKWVLIVLGWSPPILWAALLHMLLVTPGKGLPQPLYRSFLNNLGHAPLFGILAMLCLPALVFTGLKGRKVFWFSWWLALAWSLAEEFFQAAIPSRQASFLDLVTGAMGAALVLQAFWSLLIRGRLSRLTVIFFLAACLAALWETLRF